VQRSHPLVSVLAETLLERTLGNGKLIEATDSAVLGRVGCWVADGVTCRTVVALVRLRHQLTSQRGSTSTTLLVEEATALAWTGSGPLLEGLDAFAPLTPPPLADPPSHVRERVVLQVLGQLDSCVADLNAFAERRAQALLTDHRRVREAADARGSYSVKALVPADLIGVFVLLPSVG
jgi:hypothetical protein